MRSREMFNPPAPRDDQAALGRHKRALESLLREGERFVAVDGELAMAEEIRGWRNRVSEVVTVLADFCEGPARAEVMSVLDHPSVTDDYPSLPLLRTNVAGASPDQFGTEIGVTGNTIRRIEDDGGGCAVDTAKKIADRFGLRVLELFVDVDGERLRPRTAGDLRAVLLAA